MGNQTTIVGVLAVFVAIAGGVYVGTGSSEPNDDGLTPTGIEVTAEEITGLTISREADVVSLRRQEANWLVETPVSDQGNDYIIDKLVAVLVDMGRAKKLEGAVGVELGTEPDPVARVNISLQNLKKEKKRQVNLIKMLFLPLKA